MANTYQLKHSGEEIDALLDKAGTALQPRQEDGYIFVEAEGIVSPEDNHFYLPGYAPTGQEGSALAIKADIPTDFATKVELSDVVRGLKTYIDEKDLETLNSAKSYTDDAIAAAITNTLNTPV